MWCKHIKLKESGKEFEDVEFKKPIDYNFNVSGKKFLACNPTSNKYFGRKTPTPILSKRKTSLPAMERRICRITAIGN